MVGRPVQARDMGMLGNKDGIIKVIQDNGLMLFISPVGYSC